MSPSHRIIRNKRRSKAGDLLNKRSRCRSNKEYFVVLSVWPMFSSISTQIFRFVVFPQLKKVFFDFLFEILFGFSYSCVCTKENFEFSSRFFRILFEWIFYRVYTYWKFFFSDFFCLILMDFFTLFSFLTLSFFSQDFCVNCRLLFVWNENSFDQFSFVFFYLDSKLSIFFYFF